MTTEKLIFFNLYDFICGWKIATQWGNIPSWIGFSIPGCYNIKKGAKFGGALRNL